MTDYVPTYIEGLKQSRKTKYDKDCDWKENTKAKKGREI